MVRFKVIQWNILRVFLCIGTLFVGAQVQILAEDIVEERGKGEVRLIRFSDGRWQLQVSGKPFLIQGVVYEPIKVGDKLLASNQWMKYDFNKNGVNDTAYESWVDENKNNKKDFHEHVVGDFELLKRMGVNTIRIYHPVNVNKQLLRDLYERYGIRVAMGNLFGAYCWGSQAPWKEGTNYNNAQQRKNMLDDVRQMVLEFKDEPYMLMWILGNENDVSGSYSNSTFNNTNACIFPEVFARFINEAVELIHSLDPDHPVGISNATTKILTYYRRYSPALDFVGLNAYLGPFGFSQHYRTVKFDLDKPVLITEYGVDSFNQNKNKSDEDFQARYHKQCWKNIVDNSYRGFGTGNAIGGFAYTWLDGWWMCGSAFHQDTRAGAWRGPAQDGWFNDEWLGLVSQGNGKNSPFLRQLKKAYFFYEKEWNKNTEE